MSLAAKMISIIGGLFYLGVALFFAYNQIGVRPARPGFEIFPILIVWIPLIWVPLGLGILCFLNLKKEKWKVNKRRFIFAVSLEIAGFLALVSYYFFFILPHTQQF